MSDNVRNSMLVSNIDCRLSTLVPFSRSMRSSHTLRLCPNGRLCGLDKANPAPLFGENSLFGLDNSDP